MKSEIQNTLGDGFTVESGKGLAGSYVVVTKSGTGSEGAKFSPARSLNNRGGAVYNTPEGHRAVQTSSRAGVRVYGPTGRRIGPVFGSVEAAERYLSR